VNVQSHVSLTWALLGGEWSASRPGRFTPREMVPDTHWTGDWVGPRVSLDAAERTLGRPARSQSLYRLRCAVAQDRDQLRALVSMVMNLRFHKNWEVLE
jgi:hypothetical protein